jgi:non-catalytic primase subunit PriX-like protein
MSLMYGGVRINDLKDREQKVREGLKLIIRHLDDSTPVWAAGRWISTYVYTNSGKEQKFRKVYSEDEALLQFKVANFLDCRIRGYHSIDDTYTNIAPSLSLADIDRENFNTVEGFELEANRTYDNFKEILDARPTQLWTGNGYHFVNPQLAIILEKTEFKEFYRPSMQFLRFEEMKLTNNKADPCHSNNIAFGNCMLRIPGSLNSNQVVFNEAGQIIDIPPEAEIRVVYGRYWDGNKPSIQPLLPQYYIWLQAAVARKLDREMQAIKHNRFANRRTGKGTKNTIDWIEKLLHTPLDDFRKYSIKFILAPYLMNIRGFSRPDAFDTILTWLNSCDSIYKLRFNVDRKINEALDAVGGYFPQGQNTLKHKFTVLYTRLEEEGIVN